VARGETPKDTKTAGHNDIIGIKRATRRRSDTGGRGRGGPEHEAERRGGGNVGHKVTSVTRPILKGPKMGSAGRSEDGRESERASESESERERVGGGQGERETCL
jgi:hypothetical protein